MFSTGTTWFLQLFPPFYAPSCLSFPSLPFVSRPRLALLNATFVPKFLSFPPTSPWSVPLTCPSCSPAFCSAGFFLSQ